MRQFGVYEIFAFALNSVNVLKFTKFIDNIWKQTWNKSIFEKVIFQIVSLILLLSKKYQNVIHIIAKMFSFF